MSAALKLILKIITHTTLGRMPFAHMKIVCNVEKAILQMMFHYILLESNNFINCNVAIIRTNIE